MAQNFKRVWQEVYQAALQSPVAANLAAQGQQVVIDFATDTANAAIAELKKQAEQERRDRPLRSVVPIKGSRGASCGYDPFASQRHKYGVWR